MSKLSLIIPCYNEAKSLPKLIERCESVFLNNDIDVILVDNGSSDNSLEIMNNTITQNFMRIVHVPVNQGYGYGILAGLKEAKTDYLGWTHADLQTDPKDILFALKIIQQSNNASLFIKGRRYGRPWADRFFTFGMSIFESLLLMTNLYDINAQPTVFSREFFSHWNNPPHDFSLDLYAYYLAKSKKQTIKRFPVLFAKREHGHSHWNINWKSKIKFIKRTIDYSLKLKKELKHVDH